MRKGIPFLREIFLLKSGLFLLMGTGLVVSFLEGSQMKDSDFNKLESLPKKYKFYSIPVKKKFASI